MSFSPEILTKKLGSLQETQDSIVTISQWILFHHRHAQEIAQIWADYLLKLDSQPGHSSKKLSLLYLCNDVVQQARHKRKAEFIRGFATVLPKVLLASYETVSEPVKPKIGRLVSVWEQRNVFSAEQIRDLKAAVGNEPPSSKSNPESPSIKIASELEHINTMFLHIQQLNDGNQGTLEQIAVQERQYLPSDPLQSDNLPLPKIYLLKLAVLDKLCNLAVSNISSIKNDRTQLVSQLELLLQLVKGASKTDEAKARLVERTQSRLGETRGELLEILGEDDVSNSSTSSSKPPPKAASASVPSLKDDSDDEIPTYAPDSDDDDAVDDAKEEVASNLTSLRPLKRLRSSRTPLFLLGASTPLKRVAFLEDVQVKEYEREEQTELINIVRSSDDDGDLEVEVESPDDYEPGEDFDAVDYEQHHKDVMELKREEEQEKAGPDVQSDVLNILSKLA